MTTGTKKQVLCPGMIAFCVMAITLCEDSEVKNADMIRKQVPYHVTNSFSPIVLLFILEVLYEEQDKTDSLR